MKAKQFLIMAFLATCLGSIGCAGTTCPDQSTACTHAKAKIHKPAKADSDSSPDYYSSDDNPFHAD